ncbi:LysR family transcriptional regulator [Vibrio sp. AND4]|uniref:LysR family transcriptional regulator n=1 Tax=Vibrio sp. AND4 TaxID=314289 RepID=UPI00015F2F4A|nr:LysR family transcriptional regulator [Vibrio sp. AND4]EDP60738.1 Transcriptional regulator [Vibrio sp. AND4]
MDLNLLKTFDTVFQTRSVSGAADALGISAPAISQALNRLREQYQDPLFIRSGRGIIPTNFAMELHAEIQEPLNLLLHGVKSRLHFDALNSHRTFRISSHKDIDLLVVPPFTAYRSIHAPNTKIEASPGHLTVIDRQNDLRHHRVDIALSTIPLQEYGFLNHKLFEEELVVVASIDHPRVQGQITADQFFSEPHILMETDTLNQYTLKLVSQIDFPQLNVGYKTNSTLHGLILASETDWLCISTRRLTSKLNTNNQFQVLQIPFEIEPIPIYMIWHKFQSKDNGHVWLRNALIEATQAFRNES